MNLAVLAPHWLVWVLAALLAAAAIEDVVRLRIANLTCLLVLVAAVAAAIIAGPQVALWQNLLVFAGLLAIGTPLFAAGKLGGGDVKLLAVAGLWFPLKGAFLMLITVLLAGGLLALLILAIRLIGWSEAMRARVLLLRRKGGIPYGLAIAAGVLLAVAVARTAATPRIPLLPAML